MLQLEHARAPTQGVQAALSDPARLATDIAGEPSTDWVEAWVGAGAVSPGSAADAGARVWGLSEAPTWPKPLADSVELQAAVLRAGVGLGRDALLLPVEPDLGRALADAFAGEPGLAIVEVSAWGVAEVRGCLSGVVEDEPGWDMARWVEALHAATGGWPAKVVHAIEACARAGLR